MNGPYLNPGGFHVRLQRNTIRIIPPQLLVKDLQNLRSVHAQLPHTTFYTLVHSAHANNLLSIIVPSTTPVHAVAFARYRVGGVPDAQFLQDARGVHADADASPNLAVVRRLFVDCDFDGDVAEREGLPCDAEGCC